jgi:uncharacterized membrane protein YhaH (DUF805 family)
METSHSLDSGNLIFLLSLVILIPACSLLTRRWSKWLSSITCVSACTILHGVLTQFIPVRIRGHYFPESWAVREIVIGLLAFVACWILARRSTQKASKKEEPNQ